MWKKLSKQQAAEEFNKWSEGKLPSPGGDDNLINLRERLIEADKNSREFIEQQKDNKSRSDYLYDLKFGLELYKLLNEEYNLTTRDASNDEIWIYLSIKVIPDIIYQRWGLSEARFYKQGRRMWLKTMWWYIHLSWNGTEEKTFDLLKGFTTDEIVQLVERSGPNGYRIDVTREIMRQFSSKEITRSNRNLFRKVMKLNTARVKLIEPALSKGGAEKYVEELINYFEKNVGS